MASKPTINQNLTTFNYNDIGKRNITHLLIHFTANGTSGSATGAVTSGTAYANTQYFKGGDRGASAHYFVDQVSIWQSISDNLVAWHAGDWNMNCKSIGIEMCDDKDGSKYYFKPKVLENGAKLAAYIADLYNIPEKNIIRHFDVTGKVCPRPFVASKNGGNDDNSETAWKAFKKKIADIRSGTATSTPAAVKSATKFSVSGFSIPTTMSKPAPVSVSGKITGSDGVLTSVKFGLQVDGQWLTGGYVSKSVSKVSSYSVTATDDNAIQFNKLPNNKNAKFVIQANGKTLKTINIKVGTPTTITKPSVFKEYKVKVDISDLRIRKTPSMGGVFVKYIPKGVYTIIDEKPADGYKWGKLKSGEGWIALDYTKKV